MALLDWHDAKYRLGVGEMDETHREFAERVNQLESVKDLPTFQSLFGELQEHTRRHFENEERLMMQSGFFATSIHRSEHGRVLALFDRANQKVKEGRLDQGRAFLRELPYWFDLHAATMDSALAAHLKAHG